MGEWNNLPPAHVLCYGKTNKICDFIAFYGTVNVDDDDKTRNMGEAEGRIRIVVSGVFQLRINIIIKLCLPGYNINRRKAPAERRRWR